jgi:hypothetical protein
MYMVGEIEFSAPGSSISTRRGLWVRANAALTGPQKEMVAEEFGRWKPPGILRSLGLRRSRPPIVRILDGRPGSLRLIFGSMRSQTRVARSSHVQKELAQILADGLGWDGFIFRHNSPIGPQHSVRQFSASRACEGAPWQWQEIPPLPQPPRLSPSFPRP